MVYCVGQAEHPAGLHTGQSNLPHRRGELVLSLPKDDPYARWCVRGGVARLPPYPDWAWAGFSVLDSNLGCFSDG